MTTAPGPVTLSRLARLARAAPPRVTAEERCDLCAEPVTSAHRHLWDLDRRALLCACRACAVLFDRHEAGGRRYRLVPEHRRRLDDFRLDEIAWDALGVPVNLAFFVRDSAEDRVIARCPSALGTTVTTVDPPTWTRIEADNPVLATFEPDVEALLVHRARGAQEHWQAPLDVCYRLAAIVRRRWKGLAGGDEVWTAIDEFFGSLQGAS
jgi:hypothetical protein